MRLFALTLTFLISACSSGSEVQDARDDGREMTGEMDRLRQLHAQMLNLKPIVADLPEALIGPANACRVDENHPVCVYGREELSPDEWERIEAAWAEEDRRRAEQEEMLAACTARDDAKLKSMYPGHFAFYGTVRELPPLVEQSVDAAVGFGISSSPAGRAKKVVDGGMAKEGLHVQYGGARADQYSPNKWASRNNTETFFKGYYTPEVEARMEAAEAREECRRLRSTPFIQAACRRDIMVSIVRDWMIERGHKSVRFFVPDQSTWPELRILLDRMMPEFDAVIDPKFSTTLDRGSSFMTEVCTMRLPTLWLDYEFYVRTLFREGPDST